MEGAKAEQKEAKRQVGQEKWHGDAPAATARRRAAAMIRVQEADREPKSREARIVFYLSCIVRYLRAQSAKEPESTRWVGVLDVHHPQTPALTPSFAHTHATGVKLALPT